MNLANIGNLNRASYTANRVKEGNCPTINNNLRRLYQFVAESEPCFSSYYSHPFQVFPLETPVPESV